MFTIQLIDAHRLRPAAANRDPGDLGPLRESVKRVGVLQPVGALEDTLDVVYGHRRVAVCRELGLPVPTRLFEAATAPPEQVLLRVHENNGRKELSGYELYQQYDEYRQLCPDLPQKVIAERFGVDPSTLVRWASPAQCVEAAVAALRDGRIGISHCYQLSLEPREHQPAMLALLLAGASREAARRAVRKPAAAGPRPTERTDRVRLPLPGGTTLTVTGSGLDLDAVQEALAAAGKEVRQAKDKSLTVKTLERALNDRRKAAKGGNA